MCTPIQTLFTMPEVNTLEMTVTEDTLPGGPRLVTHCFNAPFARASREDDYRVAWAVFGSKESLTNPATIHN